MDTNFRNLCELESASNMKRVYFWKSFVSIDELNSTPDETIATCLHSLKDPYHILHVQEVKLPGIPSLSNGIKNILYTNRYNSQVVDPPFSSLNWKQC